MKTIISSVAIAATIGTGFYLVNCQLYFHTKHICLYIYLVLVSQISQKYAKLHQRIV